MSRLLGSRRFVRAAFLTSIAAVVVIALGPAASESSIDNRLFAFVVPTTRGPLPACVPGECGAASHVSTLVYVANANRLTDEVPPTTRPTLPNAFVVTSVDEAFFVNGVHVPAFDVTLTPPPDPVLAGWSGHWPSTVTCPGQPGSFQRPCNLVGQPAVVPGENAAIVYTDWFHANNEPDGSYVFKFTVHGTLNGTPVDLTASGPPIVMTD